MVYSEKGQKGKGGASPPRASRRPTGYGPRAVFGEAYTEDEDARSSPEIIPGEVGLPIPEIRAGELSFTNGREGSLLVVEVSEIHAYPLRPKDFEEPLFPTAASKRAVAEHLLEAPWLSRASELQGRTGGAARALEEPIGLENSSGRMEVVRSRRGRRCRPSWRRRRVEKILDRWRWVGDWWDKDRSVDRVIFRVLLSSGAVVDLARERSGGWFLVGMVD